MFKINRLFLEADSWIITLLWKLLLMIILQHPAQCSQSTTTTMKITLLIAAKKEATVLWKLLPAVHSKPTRSLLWLFKTLENKTTQFSRKLSLTKSLLQVSHRMASTSPRLSISLRIHSLLHKILNQNRLLFLCDFCDCYFYDTKYNNFKKTKNFKG